MIREEILPLIPSSVGVPAKTLFWGQMPDKPDNAIGFFEYVGAPPTFSKLGMHHTYHSFQVTARDTDYDRAMSKAVQIFNLIGDLNSDALAAYDWIRANQHPFADPGGKDDDGRFRVLCNYTAKRRRT
jgi:hypothetical protein